MDKERLEYIRRNLTIPEPGKSYTGEWLATVAIELLGRVDELTTERDALIASVREDVLAWRPIETAPKDGTPILAHGWPGQSHGVAKIFWVDDEEYDEFRGINRKFEYWAYDDYSQDRVDDWEPTHWLPLPLPPVKGGS